LAERWQVVPRVIRQHDAARAAAAIVVLLALLRAHPLRRCPLLVAAQLVMHAVERLATERELARVAVRPLAEHVPRDQRRDADDADDEQALADLGEHGIRVHGHIILSAVTRFARSRDIANSRSSSARAAVRG